MTIFKPALLEDSDDLSAIAMESKGYWGYSKEQLDSWRKDLRIEKEYIHRNIVRTIWMDSKLIGFFALKIDKECELEHLWLRPNVIGKGIGERAFEEVKREFSVRGVSSFTIVSDPNAQGFYLGQGAKKIGEVESIPQNRFLPKLKYDLIHTEPFAGGDYPR